MHIVKPNPKFLLFHFFAVTLGTGVVGCIIFSLTQVGRSHIQALYFNFQ